MNKANKNKPTNEDITYWKGYIQGYRHAIEDLKGWSIQLPQSTPVITFDKIKYSDGTGTGDIDPTRWGFSTTTASPF